MSEKEKPSEKKFEEYIESYLLKNNYKTSKNEDYNKDLCIIKKNLLAFVKDTQETKWKSLKNILQNDTEKKFIKRVSQLIDQKGLLEVLQKPIIINSIEFNLIYFKPKSGLNIDHQNLYKKNKFSILRQFYYSNNNDNSIDMCLFINGIPVTVIELKNQLTGQNIKDSEKQYKEDRNPSGEIFLKFKRVAAYFCLDNDNLSMTTKLNNYKTRFIPFNKDIINPIVEKNYKSSFFWKEILKTDSVLDILENFAHISKEEEVYYDKSTNNITTKINEKVIFPRYHQLDLIRKIKKDLTEFGIGKNYLIYHSTGSGKSYSIGWLSLMLASFYRHPTDTKRLFDSIIVITDRIVLDEQLQNTIKSASNVDGVVNAVEKNSEELKRYLEEGKDIIITTIHKFPQISDTISTLKDKSFAVIIDEVHSSQSGELSRELRKTLSKNKPNNIDEDNDYNFEDFFNDEIKSKGKQGHISYFGFSGTPKKNTLEMFGTKKEDDKFYPFHKYSMKQSIEEGFTLNVLENYTSFKRYFKIKQNEKQELIVNVKQGVSDIIKYVDSHELTIKTKSNIILDHFINISSKEILNKATGMIVVKSRELCIKYFKEINKQLKEREANFNCLVAFSGEESEIPGGEKYTEKKLNSLVDFDGNIRFGLKNPNYRLIVVANKFQTGFDEPLLQVMYLDKKLQNIQCVQTLSRINRTMLGKTKSFVLDLANDPDKIRNSFQEYYEDVSLVEETDSNSLYDLMDKLDGFKIYKENEIDLFCKIFYDSERNEGHLQEPLNIVTNRWNDIKNISEQEDFRLNLYSFIKFYTYISQIVNYTDPKLEKRFIFFKYLSKKLIKKKTERVNFINNIDLESLKIQEINKKIKGLEEKEKTFDQIKLNEGQYKEESHELLTKIISIINDQYGVIFNEKEISDLKQIKKDIFSSQEIERYMKGNSSYQNKLDYFLKVSDNIRVNKFKENFDLFKKMESNPEIKKTILEGLFKDYMNN